MNRIEIILSTYNGEKYIKEQILNGITYEVNYTYPSVLKSNITGIELYRYLLPRQKTPYNAFINNSHETIMSFSPELFFRIEGNKITTRPMKGTIRRGNNPDEDQTNREFLVNDSKNRAENLMIVDLIRNDLGIIARDGSVKKQNPMIGRYTAELLPLYTETELNSPFQSEYSRNTVTNTTLNTLPAVRLLLIQLLKMSGLKLSPRPASWNQIFL